MKTIKELSILAGASIIVAFALNYFSPAGIALVGQWDIAKGVITANEKNDIDPDSLEIGEIAKAKELYDSKKFLFVDARSRDDYDEGHIEGAVSLPVGQFDEKIEAFMEQYPPEKAIVTYRFLSTIRSADRQCHAVGFYNRSFHQSYPRS